MKKEIVHLFVGFLILTALLYISSCADSLTDNITDDENSGFISDTLPPSPVSDLSIVSIGCDSVVLMWTSPDDAHIFALRYDTVFINVSRWDSAFIFSDAIPAENETVSVNVASLTPQTFYCFAVKCADTAGNWSDLSNAVCCSTIAVDTSDTVPPEPADTIPPGVVSNFNVAEGFYNLPTITFIAPSDDEGVASVIIQISQNSDFADYDSIVFAPVTPDNEYELNVNDEYVFGVVNYTRAYAIDVNGNVGDFSVIVSFVHRYQIHSTQCITCGRCYTACPYDAISYNPSIGSYVIDVENCTGCGSCVSICPVSAIEKYVKKL